MPTDEKHGAIGALKEAGLEVEANHEAEDDAQIEMAFGADRPLFPELANDQANSGARGGPGRPKGSRNKSTKEIRDYILTRHRDPLDALGEIVSMPVVELAKALGIKISAALDAQIRAASILAPYLHQKQPMAIQVDENSQGVLVVQFGARPMGGNETERNEFDTGMSLAAPEKENAAISATYTTDKTKVGQEKSDDDS